MRSPTHAIMQPPEPLLVVGVGEAIVVIVVVVVGPVEILMTLPYIYLTMSAQNIIDVPTAVSTVPIGTQTVPERYP